jgi:hypothetical protein
LEGGDSVQRFIQRRKGCLQLAEQLEPGFRWRDAAGRPVEKANAKPVLKAPHGVAQRGRGRAKFIRRAAKAAMGGDCHKGREIVEGWAHH